jgi:hypothetical protein
MPVRLYYVGYPSVSRDSHIWRCCDVDRFFGLCRDGDKLFAQRNRPSDHKIQALDEPTGHIAVTIELDVLAARGA